MLWRKISSSLNICNFLFLWLFFKLFFSCCFLESRTRTRYFFWSTESARIFLAEVVEVFVGQLVFCLAFPVSEATCRRDLLGLASLLSPWTPTRSWTRCFGEAKKRRNNFLFSWRLNAFPLVREWHDPLCSGVRYFVAFCEKLCFDNCNWEGSLGRFFSSCVLPCVIVMEWEWLWQAQCWVLCVCPVYLCFRFQGQNHRTIKYFWFPCFLPLKNHPVFKVFGRVKITWGVVFSEVAAAPVRTPTQHHRCSLKSFWNQTAYWSKKKTNPNFLEFRCFGLFLRRYLC